MGPGTLAESSGGGDGGGFQALLPGIYLGELLQGIEGTIPPQS